MFKNKFPISSLISIAVISIGAFFILTFVHQYQDGGRILGNTEYFLFSLGLFLSVTGIALILRQAWARTVLAVCIIILSLFLIYIITYYVPDNILSKVAIYLLSIGLPLFFILLLYNEKVSIEFGDKHSDKETEDILDHFE